MWYQLCVAVVVRTQKTASQFAWSYVIQTVTNKPRWAKTHDREVYDEQGSHCLVQNKLEDFSRTFQDPKSIFQDPVVVPSNV